MRLSGLPKVEYEDWRVRNLEAGGIVSPGHITRIERRSTDGQTSEQIVHHLYEYCPGPLPLPPVELHTGGGLLYVYCAGSTWVSLTPSARQQAVGTEVWMDEIKVGEASTFVTRPGQQFFTARFAQRALPAGVVSVELRPIDGTRTQASDLFHLVIVEFCQKTDREERPSTERCRAGKGIDKSVC